MTTTEKPPSARSLKGTVPKLVNKPRGSGIGPYKLLITLMYGQHKWIERDGYNVRIPLTKAAIYMRSRVNRIPKYLHLLEDWGLLESVRVNEYWATVRIRNPRGMMWAPLDVVELIPSTVIELPGDLQIGDEHE